MKEKEIFKNEKLGVACLVPREEKVVVIVYPMSMDSQNEKPEIIRVMKDRTAAISYLCDNVGGGEPEWKKTDKTLQEMSLIDIDIELYLQEYTPVINNKTSIPEENIKKIINSNSYLICKNPLGDEDLADYVISTEITSDNLLLTDTRDKFYISKTKNRGMGYFYCINRLEAENNITVNYESLKPKEYVEEYKSIREISKRNYYQKKEIMYFQVKDNNLEIRRIDHEIMVEKGHVYHTVSDKYIFQMQPGKSGSKKILKKSTKDCSSMEALNINSRTVKNKKNRKIVFDGAENIYEFISKNEEFFLKIGFINILISNYTCKSYLDTSYLLNYLYIIDNNPALELLIKSGVTTVFNGFASKIQNSCSKNEIITHMQEINDLIDNSATKGKCALKLPTYIVSYLRDKGAKLREYSIWTSIFSYEALSKEQFEKIINSMDFKIVQSIGFTNLPNIIKYEGYKLEKVIKYLKKQVVESSIEQYNIVTFLSDYLSMCELCDVTPDLYPRDLNKAHNDMSEAMRLQKNKAFEQNIKSRSVEINEALEKESIRKKLEKISKDLQVVLPECSSDLINEGNMQSNCVGGYARSIAENHCVIFFIRKKDNAQNSFVTCEVTKRGKGQCMYKNNRRVDKDTLEYKLFSNVCDIIIDENKRGSITPIVGNY